MESSSSYLTCRAPHTQAHSIWNSAGQNVSHTFTRSTHCLLHFCISANDLHYRSRSRLFTKCVWSYAIILRTMALLLNDYEWRLLLERGIIRHQKCRHDRNQSKKKRILYGYLPAVSCCHCCHIKNLNTACVFLHAKLHESSRFPHNQLQQFYFKNGIKFQRILAMLWIINNTCIDLDVVIVFRWSETSCFVDRVTMTQMHLFHILCEPGFACIAPTGILTIHTENCVSAPLIIMTTVYSFKIAFVWLSW